MNAHLINQGAKILSACGFIHEDKGGFYVPIEKKFLLPMVLQPNQSDVFTKEITGSAIWALRAISCDQGLVTQTGVRLNIQLPNGRYLIGGNGQDVGQFAWVGSYRYLMDGELDCEPGSKISVSLSDGNSGGLANPLAVNLLFEGCYKYYLKGQAADEMALLASKLPRYQGIVNENILAPCWWHGVGPQTPEGFADDQFTYSSGGVTFTLGGALSAATKIDIDNGIDFICSRILFNLTPGATVTSGSILVRMRTNDGYALMDDYIDAPRLLGGAEWPVNWIIRGGDEVVCELALVDAAGVGTFKVSIHLEGAKRRAV